VVNASRKWLLIVLAGLGLGVGGRLGSDSWRMAHRRGADGAAISTTAHSEGVANAVPSAVRSAPPDRGLSPPVVESVEAILAATGFEQAERLGRFLVSATTADLERLLLGLRASHGRVEWTLGDAIFLRWMKVDTAGGLAFAKKENFSIHAWYGWGKTHPEAALKAALGESHPWPGTIVMRAIAQGDPLRARALLEQYPQFRDSMSMDGLASGMMQVDPAAGATLSVAWKDPLGDFDLVSGWARREPDAALAWARSLPDLVKRAEAMGMVLDQWAAVRPEMVGPTIEALPDGRIKSQLYAAHAHRLATTDPEAARAWVEAAPSPLAKRDATLELARGLAASHPAAALQVLRGLDGSPGQELSAMPTLLRPDGERIRRGDALPGILSEISAVAPAESMAFVASVTDDELQQRLMGPAFGTWLHRDSLAASEWLTHQPDGAIRQAATERLVQHLSRGVTPDFEAAAQWALTLPRDTGVSPVVSQMLREWSHHDHDAAQSFLQGPECPPEIRAALDSKPQPE
jgi:hypothetical protein